MGSSNPQEPTNPHNVAEARRRSQAVQLRIAGTSLAKIAEALGYHDATGARRAIMTELKHLREPGEEYLALELARLDQMQMALNVAVRNGDPAAITAALRVMERRAKYLGLDDFEARMAAVAEEATLGQALQASWLQDMMMNVLHRLNLSDDQWAVVPGVVVDELDAVSSNTPPDTDEDTTTHDEQDPDSDGSRYE